MVQIRSQFAEHIAVDIIEDILQTTGQLLVDEITDGHMAGRFFLLQQPEKPDIRLAELLDEADRTISKLHKGKQYNL